MIGDGRLLEDGPRLCEGQFRHHGSENGVRAMVICGGMLNGECQHRLLRGSWRVRYRCRFRAHVYECASVAGVEEEMVPWLG